MTSTTNAATTNSSPPDFWPRFYLPLLLLLCAAYAWHPLMGFDDFWAHAGVGRWIWQNGRIPQETLFLWSGKIPWIAHSWLSQFTFYSLMAIGGEFYGPYLALVFTVVMSALPFALLWHLWSRCGRITILTPFLFSLAIQTSQERFLARPELFTAFFLVCLMTFLIGWSRPLLADWPATLNRRQKLAAGGIVLSFIAWTNFHGAVAIGLMLLVATVLVDLVQDRLAPRARLLALFGVCCLAAIFINPYGARYWEALRPIQSYQFAFIDEWKPFWAPPPLPLEYVMGAALLVLLAAMAWALNPQRRWAHLLWVVLMSVAFLHARRHLWLLSLICLAVMAANAAAIDTQRLWRHWQQRRVQEEIPAKKPVKSRLRGNRLSGESPIPAHLRRRAHAAVIACIVMWLAVGPLWDIQALRGQYPVSDDVPRGIAAFIERHNLPGRMFNGFIDAPYLQWRFAEQRPLFMGHLNDYPDTVIRDYDDMIHATLRGRSRLDELNIGYVVLRSPYPGTPWPKLALYLEYNAQWARVYQDQNGAVWVRRTPEYEYLWRAGVKRSGARP